uniref:Uncharacterized protein n=1 Tax=Anopheles atroparvus TaxID=41427 RepID=A0AAG5DCL2_ANOAO
MKLQLAITLIVLLAMAAFAHACGSSSENPPKPVLAY